LVEGRAMNRVLAFWRSSVGKKAVMAATGVVMVLYLITHVLANLLVFDGPERINRYAALLHSSGAALWGARVVLLVAVLLHIVAAVQLTLQSRAARPQPYARGPDPQASTFAARTIRWGGVLILVFLVYHILHFTIGTVHPQFIELNPHHNVTTGFRNPWITGFYVVAMIAVGLHLYHGVWSSGRSLGVSQPSPRPLQRRLALVVAGFIWLGFTAIVIAGYLGRIG
jgi:succinate dehydrogenase / fumarate reductase cytochrome b subunit